MTAMNHFQPPRNDRPPKAWAGTGGSKRVRFELTSTLSAGGLADAKIRIYDRVGSSITTREIPIVVYDAEDVHSGEVGDFGRAEWMPDAQRWEVYEMQAEAAASQALWIRFTLPSALTTAQATKASATVDDYWQGSNPGATVTLENYQVGTGVYRWSGASGANGIATLRSGTTYVIVDLEC